MNLKVKNICKFYGNYQVLKNITFSITEGEIVGLLGENGSGKSTLLKILSGYSLPNSGCVLFNDKNILKQIINYKKIIGYLPESNPLYKDLYVIEYLLEVASMYKINNKKQRLLEVIQQTGLVHEQHKKIKFLSKGYKQRVGLAQALIHNPKVLILDEPSSGMDPNQLIEVRNLFHDLQFGKIILFSSHNLNEIKAICNRVLILSNGKIVGDMKMDFKTSDDLEKVFLQYSTQKSC